MQAHNRFGSPAGVARALALAGMFSLAALPARAELVFFQTGSTMSVAGHRVEGASMVLLLRGGGEIECSLALIDRIAPDEVPYPETGAASARPASEAGGEPAHALDPLIDGAAARYGVDAGLVRAVIEVESAYEPRARSPKGAMGLMQLMPATARQYALADPYDPRANIDAGVRHLRTLLDRFDVSLALAAYNAGEAVVRRFGGIPPFPETRAYVARVLRRFNGLSR